jgi:large subunit ribosomal protein L35Ae
LKLIFLNIRPTYIPTLYKKAIILGYKRSLRHQTMSCIRLKLTEDIKKKDFKSFIGKKVFYPTLNKSKKKKKLKWGKIISQHGKSGVLLAKFKSNIPSSLITSFVFITFFPYNKNVS